MAMVAVTVAIGLTSMIREHLHSAAIREHLIGTWTIPVTHPDGSVEQWIEEFRSDGTLRHYPPDKPPPETGRNSNDWQWHISGSDLVVYQSHFSPGASAERWIKQVGQLIRDRVMGHDYQLFDRYTMHSTDGNTIRLTLQEDANAKPTPVVTITRQSVTSH
jgi:hypothetical protein